MKIKEMNAIIKDKKSQDLHCNFKITGKGTSKFDLILKRLDQIDSNLEEFKLYVVDQFKKHGWVK